MIAECPQCGLRVPLLEREIGKRIGCRCGAFFIPTFGALMSETLWGLPVEVWEARKRVCDSCEKFNKDRCSLVELGCRSAFVRFVASPAKCCPISKWGCFSPVG